MLSALHSKPATTASSRHAPGRRSLPPRRCPYRALPIGALLYRESAASYSYVRCTAIIALHGYNTCAYKVQSPYIYTVRRAHLHRPWRGVPAPPLDRHVPDRLRQLAVLVARPRNACPACLTLNTTTTVGHEHRALGAGICEHSISYAGARRRGPQRPSGHHHHTHAKRMQAPPAPLGSAPQPASKYLDINSCPLGSEEPGCASIFDLQRRPSTAAELIWRARLPSSTSIHAKNVALHLAPARLAGVLEYFKCSKTTVASCNHEMARSLPLLQLQPQPSPDRQAQDHNSGRRRRSRAWRPTRRLFRRSTEKRRLP